jgi:hypothetical protein
MNRTLKAVIALMASLVILAIFIHPQPGLADVKQIRVGNIAREFKGEFEWRDEKKPYALMLKINKIEEKDGVIHFSGIHIYMPGNYKMKVEGTINPNKRSISIRELDPSRADSETDGSFEGTISEDLQTIEAVWTTKGTGNKGDLKVRALKNQ